jgi:hypothetical protein
MTVKLVPAYVAGATSDRLKPLQRASHGTSKWPKGSDCMLASVRGDHRRHFRGEFCRGVQSVHCLGDLLPFRSSISAKVTQMNDVSVGIRDPSQTQAIANVNVALQRHPGYIVMRERCTLCL